MQDDLTKAQHYRVIEKQMRESAAQEQDQKRRKELTRVADQYRRLADKLVGRHTESRHSNPKGSIFPFTRKALGEG